MFQLDLLLPLQDNSLEVAFHRGSDTYIATFDNTGQTVSVQKIDMVNKSASASDLSDVDMQIFLQQCLKEFERRGWRKDL